MTATTPSGVRIVAVGAESAALLAELHRPCFDDAWDEKAMAALLATPGTRAWLAVLGDTETEDQPVGLLIGRLAADEAEVLTLCVLPACRGQRFGHALVAAFIDQIGRAGAVSVFLEVAHGNAAARKLYEGFGFDVAGTRRQYYSSSGGNRDDALVMRLDLAAASPPRPCGPRHPKTI